MLPTEHAETVADIDKAWLLARYAKQYEKLRFDIRNLKYDRDELHDRD